MSKEKRCEACGATPVVGNLGRLCGDCTGSRHLFCRSTYECMRIATERSPFREDSPTKRVCFKCHAREQAERLSHA